MVKIFLKDKVLNPKIKAYINNSALYNRAEGLQLCLKKDKIEVSPSELKLLIKETEKKVYDQILYLAVVMYRIKQLNNEWGNAGESQCKNAFAYVVLQCPLSEELTAEHMLQLDLKIEKALEQFELMGLPADLLKQKLNGLKLEAWGNQISINQYGVFNKILRFIGSKLYVIATDYGSEKEIILAKCKVDEIQDHHIFWIQKEYMRTPNIIMAKAGFSADREVYIREESLETIYIQKWKSIFNYNDFEKNWISAIPERRISEGIKQKALQSLGVHSEGQLEDKKLKVMKNIGETIVFHELGHVTTQHNILPVEVGSIAEATKVYGEKVSMALLEILADFSPTFSGLKGAMKNMVDCAKTDPERATGLFYLYLSDTWFFDTPDTYMYLYSDLIVLSLLRYIETDQRVNFEKLDHDLFFNEHELEPQKDLKRYVNFLFSLLVKTTTDIKKLAESMTYTLLDKEESFDQIKSLIYYNFRNKGFIVDEDSYIMQSSMWTYLLKTLQKVGSKKEKLDHYFETREKEVLKKVFVASAGKKVAESFNYDHRKYIMSRMEDLKLTWNPDAF